MSQCTLLPQTWLIYFYVSMQFLSTPLNEAEWRWGGGMNLSHLFSAERMGLNTQLLFAVYYIS